MKKRGSLRPDRDRLVVFIDRVFSAHPSDGITFEIHRHMRLCVNFLDGAYDNG